MTAVLCADFVALIIIYYYKCVQQLGLNFSKFLNLFYAASMSSTSSLRLILCTLFFSSLFLRHSLADVGTAAHYGPPFLPTACYGRDASQFPSNNFFGAVGEGLWDNGAACGRQYQVRCISAAARGTCIPGQMIQIKIVDRAQSSVSRPSLAGTTLVLSSKGFQVIANASAPFINVEYQQV
ncbi:EG45-like domain containing protein 2 [Vigna radiata var. radiata]|uniref:EG45-like domain containing protein 2 n=1 Tax=Vigna radiata var. radiata TaxID=3916 RepID=A0A1S3TZY9_VIGRR|nr:EG45-like domain containing protein 2 [Vigna radiata var. radiata]